MSDGPLDPELVPQTCRNTDKEIWRENPEDFYAPSIYVTQGGGIAMNFGGTVHVRTVKEWNRLASGETENEAIAYALHLVLGNHTMVDAAIKMAQSAWKGRNIGQPK